MMHKMVFRKTCTGHPSLQSCLMVMCELLLGVAGVASNDAGEVTAQVKVVLISRIFDRAGAILHS